MLNWFTLRKSVQPHNSLVSPTAPEQSSHAKNPRQRKPSSACSEATATEIKYILDLSQVVNGYIKELHNQKSSVQIPDDLRGEKGRKVFGNITYIHKWHKEVFLKVLERCVKNPIQFGKKMENIENKMLSLYVEYCQNKPISDYIVCQHERYFTQVQHKLGHGSNVKSYIMLPVDRLFKYKPLFEAILKEVQSTGPNYERELNRAIDVMKRICRAVNDLMVLYRLENFPEQIDAQGILMMYGPLWCTEEPKNSKRYSTMVTPKRFQVFLLEQSIIFANTNGPINQFEDQTYVYSFHIKMNQISLSDLDELGNHAFRLQCKNNKRSNVVSLIFSAEEPEKTKLWVDAITKVLRTQNDFLNNILEPIP